MIDEKQMTGEAFTASHARDELTPGQKLRQQLEADMADVNRRIEAFNSHWLNHKHLVNAFAVVIMAFIFLGMLVKSIELYMWILCGVAFVALVAVMGYRSRQARMLNAEMEAAQAAWKEYERGRRKKK